MSPPPEMPGGPVCRRSASARSNSANGTTDRLETGRSEASQWGNLWLARTIADCHPERNEGSAPFTKVLRTREKDPGRGTAVYSFRRLKMGLILRFAQDDNGK